MLNYKIKIVTDSSAVSNSTTVSTTGSIKTTDNASMRLSTSFVPK